jgi:hypothetical protein
MGPSQSASWAHVLKTMAKTQHSIEFSDRGGSMIIIHHTGFSREVWHRPLTMIRFYVIGWTSHDISRFGRQKTAVLQKQPNGWPA